MKLLITGSDGFIGNYFIDKYMKQYDIRTFSFSRDDLNSLYVKDVDVVIHLSALVHQMGGASEEDYQKVNVTQTVELAKKVKFEGVEHFVFMSTVKVYGEETSVAYKENFTCKPQDDYGKSKLMAEQELQKLEDDSFKVSIIRTPIVYGCGVKANIKNLINLIKKVSILPFGNINNKRSMVYIGNLCHLVDVVVKKEKKGIFLACDDEALNTTKLVELIAKNLGKKVYLVKIPFFETLLKTIKPSFQKRLYESLEVDNTKTKKILELKNPYSVEDGIRFMISGEK